MRGHATSTDAQLELAQAELNLKRAAAARAEEELLEKQEALRNAVSVGRELQAEFSRLHHSFGDAERAVLRKTLVLSVHKEKIAAHMGAKPDAVDDFANEAEMEQWTVEGVAFREEFNAQYAEIQELSAERERLRMAGVRAYNAVEYQRGVVRNLRNKITDPEEGYMRRGWQGDVTGIR